MNFYEPEGIDLPTNADSLDVLQAIYRSSKQPLYVRMRAAALALPFERPKLQATAIIPMGQAFAERLERAIERSAKVLNHRTIESSVIESKARPQIEIPPHRSMVPDRRFRI